MRCPKCGYTSFDNLERCKRCKKNIAATATALMGTVVDAISPSFLLAPEPEETQEELPLHAGAQAAEVGTLSGAVDQVAALDGGDPLPTEGDDTPAEPDMDMDLNLSGVDISDLQAPAAELPAAEESFSLENLDIDDSLGMKTTSAPASASGPIAPAVKTGTALDDFNVELDELLISDKKA